MAQAFDEKELLERVDNDVAFLADTVQMLETDGRRLMGQVRDALSTNNAVDLGHTAHTLKGMISNFCSSQTHACALEVERIGKSGDLSAAASAIQALQDRLEALISELVEFIRARGQCTSS